MKKVAVVLFNLGGPDNLGSVKPFLFNLFNDPNIISLPSPFRYLLAKFISQRRETKSQDIYKQIGNKSPILEETKKQSEALEKLLNDKSSKYEFRNFIAMRYWHPFISDVVGQVYDYKPDTIILLPLYPQYSTTTSLSSFDEWRRVTRDLEQIETKTICCYSGDDDFINAHVKLIQKTIKNTTDKNFRILFSAHGLPISIIEKGDPYQWQIEYSTKHIIKKLSIENPKYTICYQSKVGPKKWLTPSLQDEIIKAGKKKESLIIVPISFVSEHSETLVELDIEYAELSKKLNIPEYHRVPTLGITKEYISCLAKLCKAQLSTKDSFYKTKTCPNNFCKCYQSIRNC